MDTSTGMAQLCQGIGPPPTDPAVDRQAYPVRQPSSTPRRIDETAIPVRPKHVQSRILARPSRSCDDLHPRQAKAAEAAGRAAAAARMNPTVPA